MTGYMAAAISRSNAIMPAYIDLSRLHHSFQPSIGLKLLMPQLLRYGYTDQHFSIGHLPRE